MQVVYKVLTRDGVKSKVARVEFIRRKIQSAGELRDKFKNLLMFTQCNDWVCSDWTLDVVPIAHDGLACGVIKGAGKTRFNFKMVQKD